MTEDKKLNEPSIPMSKRNKKLNEPSITIAERENMPNLTVPSKGGPRVKAPPKQNESEEQYNRKIENFRYFCTPDGYPTVINDKEGITEDVKTDPYISGGITNRSGVLGAGTPWFIIAEKNAMWRQQHSLPDRRYGGGYIEFESDDPSAYYNAKLAERDPNLEKRGPFARFINGISYVPKALILREQPALKLFSMQGSDPRQPSMEDLENDRKDPYYMSVANSLTNTRSYPVRTQIGNDLTDSRNAVNKLNQMRFNKIAYPYGEGIGSAPWVLKPDQDDSAEKIKAPHDLARHRKNVMMNGMTNHILRDNTQRVLGTIPSVNAY